MPGNESDFLGVNLGVFWMVLIGFTKFLSMSGLELKKVRYRQ